MTVRLTAVYEHGGETREAVATTLGAGGLFVASDDPPPQGAVLEVRFQVPGGTRELRPDARVVWTHAPSDGPLAVLRHGPRVRRAPRECAVLATELEALRRARRRRAVRRSRDAVRAAL